MSDDTLNDPKVSKIPGEKVASLSPPKPLTATPWVWRDPKMISPREFLYGKHYIRKFVSAGFGAPGGGKTSRRLVEALSMASGRALLGVKPVQKLKVWYWNGEDPQEETDRRLAAACLHYGIKPAEIQGYLFTDSGRTTPIIIAQQAKSGTMIADPVVKELKDAIKARGIDVMTVDLGKANMAPLGDRKWFELASVNLGNCTDLYPDGDSVGVVTTWTPPNPLEGVTGDDFDNVAREIRTGNWKESVQAKDWVGKPVAKALGLDLNNKAEKAKARGLIDIWTKNGSLTVVEETDPKRREKKKFVRVAADE